MAEFLPDLDYPVRVTERKGGYDVRIRELLLVVRGPDLRQAYEELIKRKQEVIESARAFGALDELPPPDRPALLGVTANGPSGLLGAILSRLRGIGARNP